MKLYSQRLKENNPQQSLVYDSIPQEFIQQYFYIAEDFFIHYPNHCLKDIGIGSAYAGNIV